MIGISNGRKAIEYNPNSIHICTKCGSYCRYNVFCTYMVLTLFFIPILRWSKEYYTECSNCGTIFSLNKNIGKRIEQRDHVVITSDDIEEVSAYNNNQYKKCSGCGYMSDKDFYFCPKCGKGF